MPEVPPYLAYAAGVALLPLLPRRARPALFVAVPAIALGLTTQLEVGDTVALTVYGIELEPVRVDRLSLVFSQAFAFIALAGALYGWRIMGTAEQMAALAHVGSALGIVLAGDLLTLFVFWELKVLSAVLLVWARRGRAAERAGTRYLFVHLCGGAALLGGILWHLGATGSLEFVSLGLTGPTSLVLAGFALTAAVPPLHAWLTDAYPEATVAGTVFLGAFTTKAAVYALARGFPGVELLVWAGAAMALYGVAYAVLEDDIRRLLCYHIVSQVGYMVTAVGIGTELAIDGAAGHAFGNILFKTLLLMAAGAVVHSTGASRLSELGGLHRGQRLLLALYMVGALSISAAPLFSGFVTKELVVLAVEAQGASAVVWLLKLVSIGTIVSVGLKLPYFAWFGPERGIRPGRVPASMYLAMAGLAVANLAIGVVPGPFHAMLPSAPELDLYTAVKVAQATSLLGFAAIGFWLMRHRAASEAKLSLDTDFLYRAAPGRVARALRARPCGPARVGEIGRAWRWSGPRWLARGVGEQPHPARGEAPLPTWVLGAAVLGTFVVLLAMSLP